MPADPPVSPRITRRSLIHRGKKFDFELLTVQRPGGKELQREVVRHPGAVVVVPILDTPQGKQIVLIRNFRIAVERHLVECCAGTIERPRLPDKADEPGGFGTGEDPAKCAARELIEETGYQASSIVPLGRFFTTPGLTDEQMFAFAATNLTHVGQRLEEDETIEVVALSVPKVLHMIQTGEIRDGKSMLAILLARDAGLLA